VNHTLRDAFTIEVSHLFKQEVVFKDYGAAWPHSEQIFDYPLLGVPPRLSVASSSSVFSPHEFYSCSMLSLEATDP
jgi:hypothetical protein